MFQPDLPVLVKKIKQAMAVMMLDENSDILMRLIVTRGSNQDDAADDDGQGYYMIL